MSKISKFERIWFRTKFQYLNIILNFNKIILVKFAKIVFHENFEK